MTLTEAHRLFLRKRLRPSSVEAAHPFEIGDQPGLGGLPSQGFPHLLAGGRSIATGKRREPAKMRFGLLRGDGKSMTATG
jgi:hypothetical protein